MSIPALITNAGIQAATDARIAGLQVQITEIAIGTGAYPTPPTGTETALKTEIARFAVSDWTDSGPNEVSIAGYLTDPALEAAVTEVGVFLDTGELFAIAARSTPPLLYKSVAVSDLLVEITLALSGLPVEAITITDDGNDLTMLCDLPWLVQNTLDMNRLAITHRHSLKLATL
jgi:hypothetical protein